MNLNAKKLDLIAELMKVEDESVLAKVKEVLKKKPSKNNASMEEEEERNLINILKESGADYKAGRVHSQKEVEAYFKAKK